MKTRIGLIFGGQSCEHDVSRLSAANIARALDPDLFEVLPIEISREGIWFSIALTDLLAPQSSQQPASTLPQRFFSLDPYFRHTSVQDALVDVFFPIVHGTGGEDGALQGLLRCLNKPFIGSDVLSSAVCMDKDVTKRLLRDAGLPIGKFVCVPRPQAAAANYESLASQLGTPFFVKPCNTGSSVGVQKVIDAAQFNEALRNAFLFDDKVLCEEAISGREIEFAVMGNMEPCVSIAGEIRMQRDTFYSYEAKYWSDDAAELIVPAQLDEALLKKGQVLALQAFQTLNCRGLARVDFFLKDDGQYLINELNTLPGFTSKSMYPVLWDASGTSYRALLTELVELALDVHRSRQSLVRIPPTPSRS
jgi:D-alanine-D-alanine ligase